MASLQDVNNMDWVPTINSDGPSNPGILRCTVDDCMVSNQGGQCSFYRIPKKTAHGALKQIFDVKLSAWRAMELRNDVPETDENIYICYDHYIIGRFRLLSSNRKESMSTTKELHFSKAGTILRSENGNFFFACDYCFAFLDDCRDMVDHINEHFNKTMEPKISDSRPPSPEIVSCRITDDDRTESEGSETFRGLINTMSEPKPPYQITSLTKSDLAPPIASRSIERVKTTDVITATPTSNASEMYESSLETGSNTNATDHPEIQKCDRCRLEPSDAEAEPSQHKCSEYDETFADHMAYQTHFLDTHRYQAPKCYQCAMQPSITNEYDPRRHKCAMCKEWCANHLEFEAHLKDVHGEYGIDNDFDCFANAYSDFTCYICEKTFEQRDYLVYHTKDHISELNHICPICSQCFKLRRYLRVHISVHMETKVACGECDAIFNSVTARQAHEKTVHCALYNMTDRY